MEGHEMNHSYVSVANQFAPYDSAVLQGLGRHSNWPVGRSYWSTANFRAPYDHGYFQDGSLMGFGQDAKIVLRQIPTWGYVAGGGLLAFLSYKMYKKRKAKTT